MDTPQPITPPVSPAVPAHATADPRRERIEHLFRHCTRAGVVNPLMHLVLRHRTGGES